MTGTSLVGADSGEFTIDSGGGAFTLAPGETRDVAISFRPTGLGAKGATFRVVSDDPDEGVLDVALSGTGIEAPTGGLEIVLEEVSTGGSTASAQVATSGALTAVSGDTYLAAIATKKTTGAIDVTGLGLAWTPVVSQCGGRNQTGIEVWMAQGTPSGSGPVTATLASAPSNAVIVVTRYSGVASVGNVASGNTMGESGPCDGGIDTDTYSLILGTAVADAVVYSAAALRTKAHEPGPGWTEHAEVHQGDGGGTAGAAVMDRKFTTPTTATVNGTFSSTVDWAVVALELQPVTTLTVRPGAPGKDTKNDDPAIPASTLGGEPSAGAMGHSPDELALLATRPNPFRHAVTIEYRLPAATAVELAVYDVTGRLVRRLVSGVEPAGVREIRWNGRDDYSRLVASGVYFVKMQSGTKVRLRRLILAR